LVKSGKNVVQSLLLLGKSGFHSLWNRRRRGGRNRCSIRYVVVRIAADSENKLAEKVLFSLSKGFLNILDLVNKIKE